MSALLEQGEFDELVLEQVSVTYPGPVPVVALRPVDVVIRAGEMVAVVGRSGSGKSTVLNVLGLLERPSTGRYAVRGVDVGELNEAGVTAMRGAQFGFVFQAHHLLADRTARENTEVPLLYRSVPARTRRKIALDALARVGLGHRVEALPGTLSGGERQRVNIARALAQRPRVLLCDEPTGALDSTNADAMMDLLQDLNREGLTVVIVTHDEQIAATIPRVLRMNDGQVSDASARARARR
jgi:putative ABC transport system ATP-binding protein